MLVLQIVSVVATILLSIVVIKGLVERFKLKKHQKEYKELRNSIQTLIASSVSFKEFEQTPEFKEFDEIARNLIKVKNCLKPYLVKLKEEARGFSVVNRCTKEIEASLDEISDEIAWAYLNESFNYYLKKAEQIYIR